MASRIVQRRDGHLVSGAVADDDRARQVGWYGSRAQVSGREALVVVAERGDT